MSKPDESPTRPIERKQQVPVSDKPKPMPIIDMTEQDEGIGFVIGGTGAPERSTHSESDQQEAD